MKQGMLRLRGLIGIMVWDLLTAAVFVVFVLAYAATLEEQLISTVLVIAAACFIISMLALKFRVLHRQYGRDDVTGRNNKKEFERTVKGLLHEDGNYVLIYANIDRFKLINDAYGDEVGDRVLRSIHKIIDEELLWNEVSGRIMADNFGILMHYHSIKKLDERLSRMSGQFAKLMDGNGNSYGIEMYYGVYIIQKDDGLDISAMMERANLARKRISPEYKVSMGIYDDKERQSMSREKVLEMKMRNALANGEFVPYLQPKYELQNETVAGAEALVRWIDPEEGMIYPNEFIPLFESNGFVVDIDIYMFEQVCRMVESWHKKGRRVIPVSVNLSRRHFAVPNFFQAYEDIIKKYDIPPRSIEIELTESLFFNDVGSLNDLVSRIHELGLSCSIDDFGSGYSSLNMLKEVEVDALKLDRVFFADGADSERGKDVVESVIKLAQALKLHTVSEGVEERDQVELLKDMECDLVQGYVFAKPMPVPEFEELAFGA